MRKLLAIALAAALCACIAPCRAQDAAKPAATFGISIQGQVGKPGHYSVSAEFSVLDAIELAGGFREQALRSKVTITRGAKGADGPVTTTLDYSDSPLNPANADFKLQPGDVIAVPVDPTYGK